MKIFSIESKVFGPIFAQERAVTWTAFLVIGSFIVLNLPVVLIIMIDPMPPRSGGKADLPGRLLLHTGIHSTLFSMGKLSTHSG